MSFNVSNTAYCVEYFYAKPGCRKQLIESLLKLIDPVRAEEGCLQYDLLQDSKDKNLIILLVKFQDQQAMTKHEQQPYIKKYAENELQQYCEKFIWHDAKGIINEGK